MNEKKLWINQQREQCAESPSPHLVSGRPRRVSLNSRSNYPLSNTEKDEPLIELLCCTGVGIKVNAELLSMHYILKNI